MATILDLNASSGGSSLRNSALRWLLACALAMVAAAIGWSLPGTLDLEVGVGIAAIALLGWSGFSAALLGIALVALAIAPSTTLAIQMLLPASLSAAVGGTLIRRALSRGGDGASLATVYLLSATAVGSAVGVIFALPLSTVGALQIWLGLWSGAMLTGPFLLEASTGRPNRRQTAALALALTASILAALIFGPVAPLAVTATALGLVSLLLAIGRTGYPLSSVRASQSAAEPVFDAVMRFLPMGIIRTDVDGRVVYANPMFHTLTPGATDSLGAWLDRIDGRDGERVGKAWERCRRDAVAFDEAFRISAASTPRWISLRISPEYVRGAVVGYIGIASDITAQRLEDEARNRSAAQSRAVVDNAVDAIASIDSSGTIVSFNRAAYRMFGYAPDEIIGRNVSVLTPEPHASKHDDYIVRYLTTGEARIIGIGRELEARRKDGSTLPIHLAISEVTVQGLRTFTGIMRDISLERSAKEEIRRQNERLSVTVRNAPMGIVTYRFGATFSSTNKAFETMIGYSNAELATKDLAALTHAEDRPELRRLTDDARRGSVEQFSLRLRLMHKSGIPVHVVTHNAITHDQHGVPDLVIAQVEDLTAEIQAKEAERIHQDRLTHVARLSTLGEMTAGIAHEINQPLTAISMYAQSGVRMLDAGVPKPERLREALEKLSAQSLRAGAVIDRVQRLVRKQESSFELVDVNDLIGDILRLAESDARVNDTEIVLDLAGDLAPVSADPIQIQQVLLNLIRNGIDAMRSVDCRYGSVITVTTRTTHGGAIEVSVKDRGTGVADALTAKLFTPFTTTKLNGMGMGLSICRSIIDAHGGQLNYRNNPDYGATFYFQLPRGRSHGA